MHARLCTSGLKGMRAALLLCGTPPRGLSGVSIRKPMMLQHCSGSLGALTPGRLKISSWLSSMRRPCVSGTPCSSRVHIEGGGSWTSMGPGTNPSSPRLTKVGRGCVALGTLAQALPAVVEASLAMPPLGSFTNTSTWMVISIASACGGDRTRSSRPGITCFMSAPSWSTNMLDRCRFPLRTGTICLW
jgi:hypothetical protein